MHTLRSILLLLVLSPLSVLLAQQMPDLQSPETVIKSDQLEMENRKETNHFFFKGNVRIEGNNLIATCDEMEVITQKPKDDSGGDAASRLGNIEQIIAIGNVMIEQTGRKATSERAEIHPNEEFIELIGNVHLENEHGTVTGPRFVLEKGKRARMIGNGSDDRPTVTLPGIADLGVKESSNSKETSETNADTDTEDQERRSGKR